MTKRLPVVLENLRIATPCTADWDDMAGDERVRFCGQCEKNVYNLSAMSRQDAQALVGNKDDKMCVRLYQRADGTVITADCPVGLRSERLRARIWASISGVAASAALVLGLLSGRSRADLCVRDGKKVGTPAMPHTVMMGGPMAMHQDPPKKVVTTTPPPKPPKPAMKLGEVMMGDISE